MPTAPAAIAAVLKGGVAPPKTVLVTGVSRGLGRALVHELAKRGHIVIGCVRSAEKVKSLESELMAFTPNASSSSAAPPFKHFVADLDVVRTLHSPFCSFPLCFVVYLTLNHSLFVFFFQ